MRTFRRALVSILSADSQVRTLCGRTTTLVVSWRLLPPAPLPVFGFLIVTEHRTGQAGEHWEPRLQLGAFADDATGGTAKCEDLLQRAIALLTQPSFSAQGVDAAPSLPWQLRDAPPDAAAHELGVSGVLAEVPFNVKLA